MNKSIEFIKSLIESGRMGDRYIRVGWDDAQVLNIFDFAREKISSFMVGQNECKLSYQAMKIDGGDEFATDVIIRYNPEADFSYVTSDVSSNDGTLAFVLQACISIFNKIASLQTIDSRLADDIALKLPSHNILYEVGDVCVNLSDGPSRNREKPWLTTHQTVALPIRMTLVPNEQNGNL